MDNQQSLEEITNTTTDKPASREVGISVKMSRQYGAVTVEYGITFYDDVAMQGDVFRAYEKAHALIDLQFSEFERNRLPKVTKPVTVASGAGGGNMVEIPIVKIEKQFDQKTGQPTYKAFGGSYQKYGVIIYPEYAKQFDIPAHLADKSEFKPENAVMVVEVKGNNLKVVSIKGTL